MKENIKEKCDRKRNELINQYFGNLVHEAAHAMPETIDEELYSIELPKKIESEYYAFLENLLHEIAPEKKLSEILDKRLWSATFTENDRQRLENAYHDAKVITLWEKITKSNHEDVTYYKGLLQAYTEELLSWMEADFIEDIAGLPLPQ